jgi:hypothetical protein
VVDLVSGHTPTPWHIDKPYYIYVWGPGQEMVADIPVDDEETYLARMRGVGRGATRDEQRANAEFIVRAANAHEDLLEAVRVAYDCALHCKPIPLGTLAAAIAKATGR